MKARGVYKGRPVTLDYPRILAMRAEGKGATEIAKALGCSRGAVYKVLNAEDNSLARLRAGATDGLETATA